MSVPFASDAGRRMRVLWIMLFWVLLGAAAYVFGVLSSTGQRVEENALQAARFTTDPPAPLGLVSPAAIAIALVVLGLVALWVHGIARTLMVTLVPGLAIVASQLLKSEVLGRPDLLNFSMENSFPSGHMTVFATVVAAAVFASPRRIRALIALGGAVLLCVVSYQLLGYGWHRPSDVLGALALAVAAFGAATLIGRIRPTSGVWLIRTVSIGLVVIGWALIGGSLVLALVAGRSGSADLMLSAGQFGSFGVCALAAHSMLRLSVLAHSAKE